MRAELYRIEGPWPGLLAVAPRPRGGDWLEDEAHSWRQAGVDVVVSTLTPEEVHELDLADEESACRAQGIDYLTLAVSDRDVPASARVVIALVRRLEACLQEGKHVAIHCRQGVGRSALLAACVLVVAGLDAAAAFERIRAARGCSVPDTPAQREWVVRLARELFADAPKT
jgi:protein-tyrosine phosphatase